MTNTITRITSLDEHRKLLRKVLETAKSRVLIVSPFITSSAVSQDRIADLVNRATRRGVSVDIYTDNALNQEVSGDMKQSAKGGVTSLLHAGAHVTIVQGIHNKTLARDSDLIAEGSFNWLSAVRTRGGTHQREERTMIVEGEQAKEMIDGENDNLESRPQFELHLADGSQCLITEKGCLRRVLSRLVWLARRILLSPYPLMFVLACYLWMSMNKIPLSAGVTAALGVFGLTAFIGMLTAVHLRPYNPDIDDPLRWFMPGNCFRNIFNK